MRGVKAERARNQAVLDEHAKAYGRAESVLKKEGYELRKDGIYKGKRKVGDIQPGVKRATKKTPEGRIYYTAVGKGKNDFTKMNKRMSSSG